MSSTTLTAACACKGFSLSLSFSNAEIPIDSTLCLCTTCRRLSGTCAITYILLPASVSRAIDPSAFSLASYESSEKLKQYFCETCGAHVLAYRTSDQTYHLATGICDKTEEVVRWAGCRYVEDTGDGGVSIWLNHIKDSRGERALKRWKAQDGEEGELVAEDALRSLPPKQQPTHMGKETLKAQCHCGGVKFYITRPNVKSEKVYSPFPDLMIPYNSEKSAANPGHEPWFLRNNNTQYLAGTCTCTSCRISLGFEIQTWAFIPKCNIFHEDGQPLDFGTLGTLRRHNSSDGVEREFCGRCGATVFWHCMERPELIDVSAGLFDPEEGARAEGWLEWWSERVSFEEFAVSRGLANSLQDGLRHWGRVSELGV